MLTGLLARDFLNGRGPRLMTTRSIGSGLSLKAEYQKEASWINLTVNNQKEFFKDRRSEEERYSGHVRRQILASKLAKIKPKMISTFSHGNISSSQDNIYADKRISRKWGSSSLHVSSSSNSPDSSCKGYNKETLPFAYWVCTKELDGTANFAKPSRITNDCELDSDGEGMHSNLPLCSSLEDEEGDDGEELESQTSEANEVQNKKQMAVLGDIRFLFNKDQKVQVIKDRDMKEAKRGTLEEDGEYVKLGQQLPEHETDWEDILKMVETMGLTLVPNENLTTEERKNKLVRNNKGKGELRNLSFDVHFKDSKFRRGTFNSK